MRRGKERVRKHFTYSRKKKSFWEIEEKTLEEAKRGARGSLISVEF